MVNLFAAAVLLALATLYAVKAIKDETGFSRAVGIICAVVLYAVVFFAYQASPPGR